jgi:hypothetical protein
VGQTGRLLAIKNLVLGSLRFGHACARHQGFEGRIAMQGLQ